eukprot:CAMPEP_0194161050 /NCGR_PEP_ID=MMETSP0152-20130528/78728_1 /TAXON_ID=1049557 /ORGANISM="Thalassiothrix antarctica, Strain L6-D1" /LENGTH=350 /DNA_ID=CAMNT_0038870799 /DNA_START=1011 /DNA_END=2059 /DNA_ORIENTATION=-
MNSNIGFQIMHAVIKELTSNSTVKTMNSNIGFQIMHAVIKELSSIRLHNQDNDSSSSSAAYDRLLHVHNINDNNHDIEIMDNTTVITIMDGEHNDDSTDYVDSSTLVNDWLHNFEKNFEDNNSNNAISAKFEGIAVANNIPIPFSVYEAAKVCGLSGKCSIPLLRLLDYVDHAVTSHNRRATYVVASLENNVDAFSEDGIAWLKAARDTIQRLEQQGTLLRGVRVYVSGTAAVAVDAVDAVMSDFPLVICLTLSVVFLLMVLCFRSIMAPLRSVASIALTLGFSFGVTVWFFRPSAISWLVPIMAFSIIVGLALDYDVFLVSRIWEYRSSGMDHRSSIVYGLGMTGSIIT